jgi:hypothetical protein
MSTFDIEFVRRISRTPAYATAYVEMLESEEAKWLVYNWENQEVEEITSPFSKLDDKLAQEHGILLFMYHQGLFRLGVPWNASILIVESGEETDKLPAINVGEGYEFEKDKEKLKATLVVFVEEHWGLVEDYSLVKYSQ